MNSPLFKTASPKAPLVLIRLAQTLIARVVRGFGHLVYQRTTLALAMLLCAGVGTALAYMMNVSSSLIQEQALQNARLYSHTLQEARSLYADEVVARLQKTSEVAITPDYALRGSGSIPVPATYMIEMGHRLSDEMAGMRVRLYSDYPFPKRRQEGGVRDSFEREALDALQRTPDQPFFRFEPVNNRMSLRYAEADVLKPACVTCHNTLSDSPKKDWRAGDVRGVLEVITPLDGVMGRAQMGLKALSGLLMGCVALALLGIGVVVGRLRHVSQELEGIVAVRTEALRKTNARLHHEQQKSENLLLSILPSPIARQLKHQQSPIAEGFASATVLFADLVNFTSLAAQLSPSELVGLLNEIFSRFDVLSERFGLEKIKTIGDAYMVVGGLPQPSTNHARAIAEMALAMREELQAFNLQYDLNCQLRIGINTGPVVAGVIGKKKFIYDLWGDTVNVASRMESQGQSGEIQVTEATYACLRGEYEFESRGEIPIKGKGLLQTYWLLGRRTMSLPLLRVV